MCCPFPPGPILENSGKIGSKIYFPCQISTFSNTSKMDFKQFFGILHASVKKQN